MNPVPALDDYLQDLLAAAPAPATQARVEPVVIAFAPAAAPTPAVADPARDPEPEGVAQQEADATAQAQAVAPHDFGDEDLYSEAAAARLDAVVDLLIGTVVESASVMAAVTGANAMPLLAMPEEAPEPKPVPAAETGERAEPAGTPSLALVAPVPVAPVAVEAPRVETLAAPAPEPAVMPPPAEAAPARAPAPMPPLPAYAKPVFDLLQSQARDQAHSPHGGQDRRRASDRSTRWLRMRCDDQHYALELLKVQEVVLPATLLPLRGAARHMLGVMNLRGQVVPVLDLGVYLDRAPILSDANTRIVVLEEQGEILGLRVSAVEDVTSLTEQQIEPPDNTRMCRITHPLFRGVARLTGRTVILLDASELLR